jgi:hypothetical protein
MILTMPTSPPWWVRATAAGLPPFFSAHQRIVS